MPCGRAYGGANNSARARVLRNCKACGLAFTMPRSLLAGRSNASGNFCSRPCYNSWLRGVGVRHRCGAVWRRRAREVKAANPFCAWCGTRHRLQVHHIVPERLTHDDTDENLIPLCAKHHRWIETMTVEILNAAAGADPVAILAGFRLILRCRQDQTRSILESLQCQKSRSMAKGPSFAPSLN